MGVTIRDLAEHCGLSVSAVSKALNGYSDISEATRQTVMAAVRELDYHPNDNQQKLAHVIEFMTAFNVVEVAVTVGELE